MYKQNQHNNYTKMIPTPSHPVASPLTLVDWCASTNSNKPTLWHGRCMSHSTGYSRTRSERQTVNKMMHTHWSRQDFTQTKQTCVVPEKAATIMAASNRSV